MSDLPEPMTPADCDLRGYEFMPLFGQRLFGSHFYSLALQNPRAGIAAQKLWWEAWQQCPAGSLPDDDFTLCRLADFGADLKAWAKAKAVALHGFIRCTDGRLYHPLLCEHARHAFERRRKERERKAALRSRDKPQSTPPSGGDIQPPSHSLSRGTSGGTSEGRDAESVGRGEERRGEKKEREVPVLRTAPVDARDALWSEGLARLKRITGKPDGAARGILGKFCRDARDDCALVGSLLHEAERDRPGDPVPWITAAILSRTGQRPSGNGPTSKLNWMADPRAADPFFGAPQ